MSFFFHSVHVHRVMHYSKTRVVCIPMYALACTRIYTHTLAHACTCKWTHRQWITCHKTLTSSYWKLHAPVSTPLLAKASRFRKASGNGINIIFIYKYFKVNIPTCSWPSDQGTEQDCTKGKMHAQINAQHATESLRNSDSELHHFQGN